MDYRELFPITQEYIYLNHAANSPEPLPVVNAVNEYLCACSLLGTVVEADWMHKPAEVRQKFARLLDCTPSNIAFLPNVSAAVNLVAGGLVWQPGDNVVVTKDQFPANIYPWMFLESAGVEIRFADWQTHGFVDSIKMVTDHRTRVVAVSWVEYFSGTRHNLGDVGALCAQKDIIFVVDAIQGLGAVPLSQGSTGADLIAAGGHKWLLGPEGQGAAFFSSRLLDRLNPRTFSWRSVTDFMDFDSYHLNLREGAERFEGGTPNWPGVIGLGAGLDLILDVGPKNINGKIEDLTKQVLEGLAELPVDVITPCKREQRAGIVTFYPLKIQAEELNLQLSARGIICSIRRGAVRVSPHFYNTAGEIQAVMDALKPLCKP